MGLRNWQKQYEAIFSNLPVGLSYLTTDMRYIRINPYLEDKIGKSSEEVEGLFCYEVVGMFKDDQTRKGAEKICDPCGVKTAIDTGKPYKFIRKSREGLIVENTGVPVKDDTGKIIGVIEIINEITEMVLLQERLKSHADELERTVEEKTRELRKSRAFLNNLVEGITDAVFTLDSEGRITYANTSAGRMLSVPEGGLTLRPLIDTIPEADVGLFKTALEMAVDTGKPTQDMRIRLIKHDGTGLHSLMSISALPSSDEGARVVCVCKDVTRERELETDKAEFIQMLSHDLKTPLTAVTGYSALMLDGELGSIDGMMKDSAQGIFNNARKMSRLLEDFLSAEKIGDVSVKLRARRVDIGVLLANVVEGMSPIFADKSINLSSNIPESLPGIHGDPDKLERVFANLLNNAVKYTYQGSRVGVDAERENGHIIVKVWDTGPGIPAEDIPNLFEKYFRAKDRTQGASGTGLGLYIARAITEAHGGSIDVKSRDGAGSVFEVRLPVA
jgi:PAS domain S-box-containing protein